jgi:ribosomal protein S18 acetylase RimI-like enzyme
MNTRLATTEDAAALAELFTAFNQPYPGTPVTTEQIITRLKACQGIETTVIVEIDKQIVGFACLRLVPYMSGDEMYAELTDLFVAEPYRRRGAGQALMMHIEMLAQTGGAKDLILLTGHDNDGAQAFYRAMGYGDYAVALRRRLPQLNQAQG